MESILRRIYKLKLRLLLMGYSAFQVDEMFRGTFGNAIPEEASLADCEKLAMVLEKHIQSKGPTSS